MTPREALNRLERSGCRLRVDAQDLVLESDREPPASLVDAIREHKAEIVALLRAGRSDNAHTVPGDAESDGLSSSRLREWFVVKSHILGGEQILIVANPDREQEARAAHPGLVVYMSWEVRTLLNKNTAPMLAARFHRLKALFDAVILPEPEATA